MLTCLSCRTVMAEDLPVWKCNCGGYLKLLVPSIFSPTHLKSRPRTLWRYREALGINRAVNVVSLGEGFTPLVDATFNHLTLKMKLDYLCPTGSFKDRGSSVMLSKLKEWGIREIVEDSSGNAGASVSAYAAAAGISSNIFVPSSASVGKIVQIAMYGATVVRVAGSREDTERQAIIASEKNFYASHNWSPYFLAGMQTAAYELSEQLNWSVPDCIIAPLGGGTLIAGLYSGFLELMEHGFTKSIPRLIGVQALNCAPVYQSWKNHEDSISSFEKGETVAEGIAIARPIRHQSILEAIRGSNGLVCAVTEEEIWRAFVDLARQGFYVEPTSAAALAPLSRLIAAGDIGTDNSVVIFLTGSGLKATDKVVNRYLRSQTSEFPDSTTRKEVLK